jgi:hypothetical protein
MIDETDDPASLRRRFVTTARRPRDTPSPNGVVTKLGRCGLALRDGAPAAAAGAGAAAGTGTGAGAGAGQDGRRRNFLVR